MLNRFKKFQRQFLIRKFRIYLVFKWTSIFINITWIFASFKSAKNKLSSFASFTNKTFLVFKFFQVKKPKIFRQKFLVVSPFSTSVNLKTFSFKTSHFSFLDLFKFQLFFCARLSRHFGFSSVCKKTRLRLKKTFLSKLCVRSAKTA